MKFVFRTDASTKIGSGHVMRCLTAAEELKKNGAEITFISRAHEGNLNDLISSKGMEVVSLPVPELQSMLGVKKESNDYGEWLGISKERDAEQTISALGKTVPDWLIVDHYGLDEGWEKTLRAHVKNIMVIDDLADRPHDCDLLLDQNWFENREKRYEGLIPPNCTKLLGPEYALLQPQYAELHPCTPPRMGPIQRIFVFFGGADNDNLTGRAIAAFLALGRPDIVLDVVINPVNHYVAAIREQVKAHANITLHEALPSLARLMLKADLAIGAGGTTSWERCCLGLPSVIITLAENQKPIAAALDRQGFARWLGHQDSVSESTLTAALENVLENERAADWSHCCMELVDGKGAARVAAIVSLYTNTKLKSRLARLGDEELILRWANDRLVRENPFSLNSIDPAWFYKRLQKPESCRIYIIETEQGLPIGQACFEWSDGGWHIDYSLDGAVRSQKQGVKLLRAAMQAFRRSISGALLFGRMKQDHLSSQSVFMGLGFTAEAVEHSLSIAICSDSGSWINEFIPQLLLDWLAAGYKCTWAHSADELPGGDVCFYLSYSRIVDRATLNKYQNNLVVHESDLPTGKGWSPLTWQILEGVKSIPITLLEVDEQVDSGDIYYQDVMEFEGHELINEMRRIQAEKSIELCNLFIENYPEPTKYKKMQQGVSTYYRKRNRKDSELDITKPLIDNMNLLRTVDNDRYPAFFFFKNQKYRLLIEKDL
jgi:UDP-2,4-diacetamido-2,4,6-trideoxy-beta-L-altropyranose hydrolase